MKRESMYKILSVLMRALTRPEFYGSENLPSQGGVLVATNHMSRLDTPLLLLAPNRPDLTCLVTDKYKKNLFFKFILESAGAIWLDRTKADFTAFRVAIDALKEGAAVGIAPEGTRSKTAQLLEGKQGTVLLAYKADVPIVPVGLSETDHVVHDALLLRRPRIVARFGPAFRLPPIDRANRDEWMQRCTDEIMCRIAVLLPAKYHGFYANHPRLKELLDEFGAVV